jgi:hypothetical protein
VYPAGALFILLDDSFAKPIAFPMPNTTGKPYTVCFRRYHGQGGMFPMGQFCTAFHLELFARSHIRPRHSFFVPYWNAYNAENKSPLEAGTEINDYVKHQTNQTISTLVSRIELVMKRMGDPMFMLRLSEGVFLGVTGTQDA